MSTPDELKKLTKKELVARIRAAPGGAAKGSVSVLMRKRKNELVLELMTFQPGVHEDEDIDDEAAFNAEDEASYGSRLGPKDAAHEGNDSDDQEDDEEDEDDEKFVHRIRQKVGLESTSQLFLSTWTDPTFLFLLPTLLSAVFVDTTSESGKILMVALDAIPARFVAYVGDASFVAGGVFLCLAYYLAGGSESSKALFSPSERRRAGWYLWNGCICHVMLDGMVGQGYGLPIMQANYKILDKRFTEAGHEGERALVSVVTFLELTVHSSLCLAAYVGIARRSAWRDIAATLALTFQLFGAIVFIVPDLMTGCPNMIESARGTCVAGLTPYELFFYWFGVGANLVWILIPGIMLWSVVSRSSQVGFADSKLKMQ